MLGPPSGQLSSGIISILKDFRMATTRPRTRKWRVALLFMRGEALSTDQALRLRAGVDRLIDRLCPKSYAPDLEIRFTGGRRKSHRGTQLSSSTTSGPRLCWSRSWSPFGDAHLLPQCPRHSRACACHPGGNTRYFRHLLFQRGLPQRELGFSRFDHHRQWNQLWYRPARALLRSAPSGMAANSTMLPHSGIAVTRTWTATLVAALAAALLIRVAPGYGIPRVSAIWRDRSLHC